MAKPPITFASTAWILWTPSPPWKTNRLEEIDARFTYDEDRIQVIGMARGYVLFAVVTFRGEDICRIISARKAMRHEQDRYYAGNRETW
jgi:uncharacterized protein